MCNKTKTKINTLLGIAAMVMLLAISIVLFERDRSVITINQVKAVVNEQFNQATATEVNLRTQQGIKVYDIALNNGLKVRVDARNGGILKVYALVEKPWGN